MDQTAEASVSTHQIVYEANTATADPKIRLKRELSWVGGTPVLVGGVIGSGIFVTPASVFRSSGSVGTALLIWISSGILSLCGSSELQLTLFASGVKLTDIVNAFYGAQVSFIGWKQLSFLAEDMADPVRNLQRSLMAGLLVTTVIYVLTNVAYAVVLDFDALSSSDAIASAFALKAWGEVASPAVPVAVSVSVFGMLCASFFGSSRLILAAARTGHLPRVLSLVTIETRVPLSCVLFKGVLGTLFLFFSSLEMLIQAVVFVDSLWDIVVVQSLVLLRSVVKERRQSYKVPLLVAVLRLASSISLVIMPLLSPTVYCQYLVILSVYAAGVLYYGVIVAAHFEIRASRSLLHFLQKLLLSVPCFDELTFMLQQTGCDNAKVGVQMDNAYSEPLCMHDAGSLEGASKDESGRNLCSEVGGTRYRHSALRRFVNSSEARKAHSNTTSETTRF